MTLLSQSFFVLFFLFFLWQLQNKHSRMCKSFYLSLSPSHPLPLLSLSLFLSFMYACAHSHPPTNTHVYTHKTIAVYHKRIISKSPTPFPNPLSTLVVCTRTQTTQSILKVSIPLIFNFISTSTLSFQSPGQHTPYSHHTNRFQNGQMSSLKVFTCTRSLTTQTFIRKVSIPLIQFCLHFYTISHLVNIHHSVTIQIGFKVDKFIL